MKVPPITGARVVAIRNMTKDEIEMEGWQERFGLPPLIIEFDNGVQVYASRDSEGNGAGVMFGKFEGTSFYAAEEKPLPMSAAAHKAFWKKEDEARKRLSESSNK